MNMWEILYVYVFNAVNILYPVTVISCCCFDMPNLHHFWSYQYEDDIKTKPFSDKWLFKQDTKWYQQNKLFNSN